MYCILPIDMTKVFVYIVYVVVIRGIVVSNGGVDRGWLDWDNYTVLNRPKHSILYFVSNLHFNIVP